MIFNKLTYHIPNKTKNNTNLKDYLSIRDNFTIFTDFQSENLDENESTIICRDGYPMGLYLQLPNIVKFVWHTNGNIYNEVKFLVEDIKQKMNVKVTVSESIDLYLDDVLMDSKIKGDIIDYSEKRLLIGSQNPYGGENEKWFNGVINRIIIYNTLVDYTDKNVYINMDFEENSKFKTFDKSGNGNHGIIIEDPKYVDKSIDTFNNVAPKQKII